MKRDQPVQLAGRVSPTSFRSILQRNGQECTHREREKDSCILVMEWAGTGKRRLLSRLCILRSEMMMKI